MVCSPFSCECQLHDSRLPCGGGGWKCGGVCTNGGTQCQRRVCQHVHQWWYRKTCVSCNSELQVCVCIWTLSSDLWPPGNVDYSGDSFQFVFPTNPASINQYLANNAISLPESTQCANITILDNTILGQNSVKMFTLSLSSENSSVTITSPDTSAVEVIDNDCTSVFGVPRCTLVHILTSTHEHTCTFTHSCLSWIKFNGTRGLGGCTISEYLCSVERRGWLPDTSITAHCGRYCQR